MKHWNKQPHRRATWTRVTIPATNFRNYYTFDKNFEAAKKWCWDQPSTGKFYIQNRWDEFYIWFEQAQDATWFIMSRKNER